MNNLNESGLKVRNEVFSGLLKEFGEEKGKSIIQGVMHDEKLSSFYNALFDAMAKLKYPETLEGK